MPETIQFEAEAPVVDFTPEGGAPSNRQSPIANSQGGAAIQFDPEGPAGPATRVTAEGDTIIAPGIIREKPSYFETPADVVQVARNQGVGAALMTPVIPVPLVRNPQDFGEGLYNTAVKGMSALTSPIAAVTAPLALEASPVAAIARPVLAATFGVMGAKGAGTAAGELAGTPNLTTGQKVEKVGDIAQNLLMAGAPAMEGAAILRESKVQSPKSKVQGPEPFPNSEFGGEGDRAVSFQAENPIEFTPEKPAGAGAGRKEANATNEGSQQIGSQSQYSGVPPREDLRANAVEVRSGGGEPAGGGGGVQPGRGEPASVAAPSAREADVSPALISAPEGVAAPEGASAPTTSGAVPLTLLSSVMNDVLRAREPIPVSWLEDFGRASGGAPFALPEGYAREGERFVYTEPARAETPAQRMVREQNEAMAGLRAQQAGEVQSPRSEVQSESETRGTASLPRQPTRTERVEPGTPVPVGERPPDVLDWVSENASRGVRFGSKADFGDYVERWNETRKGWRGETRPRDVLTIERGRPADEVLNDMHRNGEFLRLQTPDDLAEAMIRAQEGRKGWEQQSKAQSPKPKAQGPNPMEAVDDPWQATIDRLNSLKVETAGTVQAFGLVPEAWNTLIDLVKLGVKAGKTVSDAVDWAIGKFKEKFPGTAFEEDAARSHLVSQFGARETGQKILASDRFSEATKQAASNYLYERRSLGNDQATAEGLVQSVGLEGAVQAWRDPPGNMPEMVRSRLAGSIGKAFQEAEAAAEKAGDLMGAQRIQARAGAFLDDVMERSTELAQGLKGLDMLAMFSPDAVVARLRRQMDRAADERVARHGAETTTMQTALDEGRREGIDTLRQDARANEAARTAVNDAVANSRETHKAVVMEMAEPWASSTEVMRLAREQVRAKADELLNRGPRPPGLTPAAHLRTILDDLGKRAASIAAGHYQGAEPLVTLAKKLQQRLGLAKDKAEGLARAFDKEWVRQVKKAKAKLPQRIANARVARERAAGNLESTGTQLDAAIRRQLGELNLKLGDVLKQESARQGQTQAHVAERIVQASGLEGPAADTLRNVLQQRWDALVTGAQARTLETLQRRNGVTVSRPLRTAFDRLTDLDRLGALTSERFYDTVKQALKLPKLEAADAAALRRMVKGTQSLPEGFMRQRQAARVEQFIAKLRGDMKWWDVPMGVFYANILSGLTTPAKIVFENSNLLAGHTITALLSRPGELLHPVDFARAVAQSYGRGLIKGGLQAADTMRSGIVSGVWERPKPSGVMEMQPFGARMEPLNFWKWFTRVIGTSHELTFKPAWEVQQTLMARELARREGLRGDALQQRTADLLGNTDQAVASARAQAVRELGEGGDRLDLARRTREIIEQQREAAMPGATAAARDFALRTTYLNEPYGFLGLVANGVRSTLEAARKQYPAIGTGVKAQVPFTTIVANILNEKLNWTPAGLVRAMVSHKTGELYGRPIMSAGERAELYAKAILGTAAMGALWHLFGDHIHGNGPSTPQQRKQLQAAGWVPHSIELNGRYYSYMNTPAAVGMAIIGNLMDWHRYGKGDAADGATRGMFALKATANAIVSQGMLDSLKRIFEALGSESTTEGADKLQRTLARTGSSFVVPNLVQQLDRLWDPKVYDQTGMGALVKGQIPFVRRENKPVLTVLGDPVQSGPFHYWAGKTSQDELLRVLAEKQAWVPEPGRNQIIGDKSRGEDYYRAMTPDEFYDFIAESGPRIRARLEQNLDRLELMEPDKAKAFVAKVADEEHAKVKKGFRR